MYDHLLRHGAGRSLYTLYQALKRQTEKGPVDAVTGDACYSLSEQNLLCETFEAKLLVICHIVCLQFFLRVDDVINCRSCDKSAKSFKCWMNTRRLISVAVTVDDMNEEVSYYLYYHNKPLHVVCSPRLKFFLNRCRPADYMAAASRLPLRVVRVILLSYEILNFDCL
jgi:hypothetical protein